MMRPSSPAAGAIAFISGIAFSVGVLTRAADFSASVSSSAAGAGTNPVLSVLGSSVAKGFGSSGASAQSQINGSFVNGYAARLTVWEATNGWRVVNQSVGGDTTARVRERFYRDEVPVHADADLIALSLGNEGLAGASNPQAVCTRFLSGITNLIAMSRANNLLPLLGNQYPRDAYTAREYARLKDMDLQMNTLDVPSVNFLGATDDGAGHWVKNDFINLGCGDGIHPNDAGFQEMFLTIVPSVFEAVRQGKPSPQWGDQARFLRLMGSGAQTAPLNFHPGLMMHSFSVSFRVRTQGTGTVAAILLAGAVAPRTVEITSAGLLYVGAGGVAHNSGVAGANGLWHEVVLAHQYARGKTWFYVDGALAAVVWERLTPGGFVLGGKGTASLRPDSPAQAEYQDWLVYRSVLNAEEVTAQRQGKFQQASLELYAPLDDKVFAEDGAVTNRAQSLAIARLSGPGANFQPGTASAGGRQGP